MQLAHQIAGKQTLIKLAVNFVWVLYTKLISL